MHDFGLYFNIGRQHIADLRGLDHILFVTALCIRYLFNDWKKLLILITAFTIGHSVTLALSVFNIIRLSSHWIEFLIPLTIIITAITNVFVKKFVYKHKYPPIYFLALFFGLIHGLGFSNYLKSLLGRGNIVVQLLAFNLGLEVGQLLIVLAILLLTFVCVNIFKVNRREYILFLSGGVLAVAIQMALQRLPF
ncbi:MAG: HupE/UreJ family protein [Segetibacter sp.]|nr:HupE/UreJ family protein [Segetibacter sp.]